MLWLPVLMYTDYQKSCNWLHHTLGFKNYRNVEAAPTSREQNPSNCLIETVVVNISPSVFPWLRQSIFRFLV